MPPPPPATTTTPNHTTDTDPFDALLSLEDEYYTEGHALGVRDGARAGQIEGRVFGLEKGFEKFVALGAQHGRAAVWGARLPSAAFGAETEPAPATAIEIKADVEAEAARLPPLKRNPRLARHIATLHALTEPASLPTQNTEDGVSEVEDRARRAAAKARLIENIAQERGLDAGNVDAADPRELETEILAAPRKQAPKRAAGGRAAVKVAGGRARAAPAERNMEDFGA